MTKRHLYFFLINAVFWSWNAIDRLLHKNNVALGWAAAALAFYCFGNFLWLLIKGHRAV